MADDYARHALSQRAAFQATHPAALAAARLFAAEPVLRVVDLGAADGVNSHDLIRSLMRERAGRKLAYALVDLPTNAWGVAAEHLHNAFARETAAFETLVLPSHDERGPGIADVGTGAHYDSAEAHGEGLRQAFERTPAPTTVITLAGIPLHQAPCLPSGTVHVAVTGTAMHWVADATGLASTGSVFPGYPDHRNDSERRAWGLAASRQWKRLLELRANELAPGGYFVAAVPASPEAGPERAGLYVQLIADMNAILAEWCRAGRIDAGTVSAIVVPVWMRTLDEIRAPFEENGGSVAGLELESAELFRLDNPYWDDDPEVFARSYVRSARAWGGLIFLRAFEREGDAARASRLLDAFLAELEQRVAEAPARYRWDYVEALIVCRKLG